MNKELIGIDVYDDKELGRVYLWYWSFGED